MKYTSKNKTFTFIDSQINPDKSRKCAMGQTTKYQCQVNRIKMDRYKSTLQNCKKRNA